MTPTLHPKEIERHLKHSAQLRSRAFTAAMRALGQGLRREARRLVLLF